MSVVDTIKKSVLENFTGTVSVGAMLISLLLAFAIGLFIVYVYRKTYTGVVYSKAYSLCIIMLAMVTAMIIRTISSNISLSLGMVGALSIVRFRTAIKEPVDTSFMFWGISAVIKYNEKAHQDVLARLKKLHKFKVRSKSIFGKEVELSIELDIKDNGRVDTNIVDQFSGVDGVINASLIAYQNDFGD